MSEEFPEVSTKEEMKLIISVLSDHVAYLKVQVEELQKRLDEMNSESEDRDTLD